MSLHSERKLRVFAFDPTAASAYENRSIRHLTIGIPWEMDPVPDGTPFVGPRGEYLEVIDFDPASGVFYDPVDINDPRTRPTSGLTPAADNPKFHQQMVYAVAMDTIATFEQALGRVALWAPRKWTTADEEDEADFGFVKRLRIYPHALREANAYYDPARKALLFGYFNAGHNNPMMLPGSTIFTCLSHDIIVHETCHALLDGMHPYFAEPSNPDVLALHEGFSDIVAILQHFSHPSVLEDQICRTRGNLENESRLGQLAQEFGVALGRGGALRDALGGLVDGEWQMHEPDNRALEKAAGPHQRGSILVAAVFRAFLSIFDGRVIDLLRIASGGTGILPKGQIDPDLSRRLAREAAKSARHLLRMCIRGLDYCPPVDVTLGCYLRAIITADRDLYPEDKHDYRTAIIEAFTAWGISPDGMSVVTEDTLLWPTAIDLASDSGDELRQFVADFEALVKMPGQRTESTAASIGKVDGHDFGDELNRIADAIVDALNEERTSSRSGSEWRRGWNRDIVMNRNLLRLGLDADRRVEHLVRRFYALLFWGTIHEQTPDLLKLVGINLSKEAPKSINRSNKTGLPAVQVHSVRMAERKGDRGKVEYEYVIELVQSRAGYFDPAVQAAADKGKKVPRDFVARSGVTLLIDARSFEIRRVIQTRGVISEVKVMERHRAYRMGRRRAYQTAFASYREPHKSKTFAALHRGLDRENAEWPE